MQDQMLPFLFNPGYKVERIYQNHRVEKAKERSSYMESNGFIILC